ncbi:purple acid phosphatase family protein [Mobilicoccus caccae]|uniref:Calcineurin-like phosphoesterase family protein n=1 Tax=Mobilicoccus caccae TaxID=1859295 RepID=A0ABQ6IU53_9MICO|nr:metallophosphoesterase family protein [Mobilicoccus caccae]GMA40244.1 hypothetical protein GCM10025883_22890 [Mobilicoccus caccae]
MRGYPVRGLHIQFGGDAAREVVVSWFTEVPVTGAHVRVTPRDAGATRAVDAATRSYTDARSGRSIHAHHAVVTGLTPDVQHDVVAVHDGASPEHGDWRTAPTGRAPLSFTTFGDQGVPMDPDEAAVLGLPVPGGGLGAPEAAGTTAGVESLRPLFHLPAGDLAYTNLAVDRVETWVRYWDHTSTSARFRPWMPVAGNHENELGNGPLGYDAYRTFFALPHAEGHTEASRGLWYAFTTGSVRIVGIHTDDLALQDAGDSYVHGYSGGAQLTWLRNELATARTDPDIDWIVVVGHQVCMSTADLANGGDLGLRRTLIPLCDEFDVDLVLGGHDHHYERSHPIRGCADNETLTPYRHPPTPATSMPPAARCICWWAAVAPPRRPPRASRLPRRAASSPVSASPTPRSVAACPTTCERTRPGPRVAIWRIPTASRTSRSIRGPGRVSRPISSSPTTTSWTSTEPCASSSDSRSHAPARTAPRTTPAGHCTR